MSPSLPPAVALTATLAVAPARCIRPSPSWPLLLSPVAVNIATALAVALTATLDVALALATSVMFVA